ncbi:hypothetical protein F8388_012940 [Cannabis sativa]|uniref:Uncharacterized protein n=1 Tax=Cannabis sativa TaxID=3483 RepID=A0A7J6EUX3_CANSA|nr:hypothetical protein G4B88_018183 [Cannabis sativa]KAF4361480.1 hypothetical protein F8388_012940 [Cannabis sativa]
MSQALLVECTNNNKNIEMKHPGNISFGTTEVVYSVGACSERKRFVELSSENKRRDRSTEVGLSTKKRGEFEGNHWKWPLIMTGAILEISSCSQPIQVNGSSTLTLHPTLCLTRSWIQATYAW